MNILVTGGAGFIGSCLVERLVKANHTVSLLLRPSSDCSRIEHLLPQIQRMDGDVTDKESVQRCVEQAKPDGIFHLAASNIRSGMTAAEEDVIRTNVLGMQNLLMATKDLPYRFFVHTGSYLEYGPRADIIHETDRCDPLELYAVTKLAATLMAQGFARSMKKPIITFRIFSPYGPGMQPRRLVREVIERALRGEEIALTEPEVARDFIYVEDIVDLLMESMEKATDVGGEVFNLGSGHSTSLQEFVDAVLTETHSKSAVRWHSFPTVGYDTNHSQADMDKVFRSFRWRPAHSLASGIAETVRWTSSLSA